MHRSSSNLAIAEDLFYQIRRAAQHAPDRVGVPAQEFCRTVDDEVRSQWKRTLVDGSGKSVVNDGKSVCIFRGSGQSGREAGRSLGSLQGFQLPEKTWQTGGGLSLVSVAAGAPARKTVSLCPPRYCQNTSERVRFVHGS